MKLNKITNSVKCNILLDLLIQEVGFDKATDMYNTALRNYPPIEYAVNKPIKELEKR